MRTQTHLRPVLPGSQGHSAFREKGRSRGAQCHGSATRVVCRPPPRPPRRPGSGPPASTQGHRPGASFRLHGPRSHRTSRPAAAGGFGQALSKTLASESSHVSKFTVCHPQLPRAAMGWARMSLQPLWVTDAAGDCRSL